MIRRENLKEAKKIYLTGIMFDFPISERMPYSKYKKAIKDKRMKAYGYYVEEKRIGYIITIEDENVIFISYLAIKKEERDKGYGTKMLTEVYKYFEKRKFIIIEADSPNGIKNEKELNIIRRRKNFYFKNGFEEIENIDYCIYGVKYDLLVYKLNCDKVTNIEATEITKKLYSKITSNMKFFKIDIKN